jgi:hypothetical protein
MQRAIHHRSRVIRWAHCAAGIPNSTEDWDPLYAASAAVGKVRRAKQAVDVRLAHLPLTVTLPLRWAERGGALLHHFRL